MKLESASPALEADLPEIREAQSGDVAAGGSFATNGYEPAAASRDSPSAAWEKWLLRKILEHCGGPPVRFTLWDGTALCLSAEPAIGTVAIRDRSTLRQMALNPNLAFGDGFATGAIEIEGNLVDVLCALSRSQMRAKPQGWLSRVIGKQRFRRRSHTQSASRSSVYHHYDIGNEFYRLWLDEQLLYTCAYYASPDLTLEQAQIAKLDHVCRKLRLRPGERVVEAGCGWGALALHMAEKYGVSVRAYNLSREQVRHARESASRRGLSGQVEFVEADYRDIRGEFDAFVSVGMLEHVGIENFHALGQVIHSVLTPAGRGLIHSIGRNTPRPLDAWIDERIFPGANPPAISEMTRIFEPWRLSILDLENIRLHYARTLEDWLERYERSADRVRQMFDERFVRTWRLYLAGSIAAFRVGSLQLFQVLFNREASNEVPWTRAHLYPSNEITTRSVSEAS